LRREPHAADCGFDTLAGLLAFSLRMQKVTRAADDLLVGPEWDDAVLDRNGGQVEMFSTALLNEMPREIVFMQGAA
jgi:hypothetical protein